ncbi:glycosyltransferase [Marinobacter sp. NP-4(2019)]|uniref:glycosyltransferase n=1 Tax=Marinobacter sp. NP-4(2019) TaxID=2488665 RepID=UPI000FC3F292|nr:glycosyltransferase [Marinobacter sp. NP-4(2019)]AZT84524.1 glycosyltransferase [Marinobacter sp. NP-4(2019)]
MYVITGLGLGGAEKVVTSLADEMADRGNKVLLVYMTGDALLRPSNPAVELVKLEVNSPRDLLTFIAEFRQLHARFEPDVVHTHLVHANIIVRLSRLITPIRRLITTAHNRNEEGRFRMVGYRVTNWLADVSTNVSAEAVRAFELQRAIPPGKMLAVHNGISLCQFQTSVSGVSRIRSEFGLADDTKLIVSVGRLSEPKDYPNLLNALARVGNESSDWHLAVAGDGPLRNQLGSLTQKLGLDDRVSFLGVRNDIPDLLSAADLFVLSSAWEGFPMVVGEAMACECVVVATDCGGVREFLGDSKLLVKPKSPEALAAAINDALKLSPDQRAAYGQSARKRIREFYSLEATVDKWLAIYKG